MPFTSHLDPASLNQSATIPLYVSDSLWQLLQCCQKKLNCRCVQNNRNINIDHVLGFILEIFGSTRRHGCLRSPSDTTGYFDLWNSLTTSTGGLISSLSFSQPPLKLSVLSAISNPPSLCVPFTELTPTWSPQTVFMPNKYEDTAGSC